MKRNRLIRSSKRTRLFSDTTSSLPRYFAIFILLAIIAFSVVNFLSQNNDTPITLKSNVIDLPGLPATEQIAIEPSITSQNLPTATLIVVPDVNKPLITSPAIIESELNLTSEQGVKELDWQQVTVKSGDNLSLIFNRAGLTARDVYDVTKVDKKKIKPLLYLKPEQVIYIGTLPAEDGNKSLEALKIIISPLQTFYINKNETGYSAEMKTRDVDIRQQEVTGMIESSLFMSGLTAGLSDKIVMEMAHIFGWDIDFALDLRKGDHFKLIYDEHYLDGEKIDDGEILAAEFINQGKTYSAIRFTDKEGNSDYFSPDGDSMRKTFNRTPVPLSRISSRFNPNRKHPVLHTNRPHRGVDYAAKRGTPILATGDGKVDFVGRKGGYGRTVILSHIGKYTTLYAHMSRYRKGIKRGQRIKQGQTLGYIGSSGLATGPHLHYEFRVNGIHRNPLTVTLPKAQPLAKRYRAEFKIHAAPFLAQLVTLSDTEIAQSEQR